MNQSINPSHPFYSNLIAYYPMNEGTGTVLNDASSFAVPSFTSGNPVWLKMKGENILRNFSSTDYRPNIIFVQGVYGSTIQDILVRDSVLNTQNSVYSFQLAGNDLQPVDTVFVWQSGFIPVSDESGNKIDSVFFATEDSITITTLNYFSKWAQKIELISFVTPYGINLDLGMNGKMWLFDVSDYAPVLKGKKLINVQWGGEWQEDMDISFMFIKGTPPRNVLSIQQIWPVTADGYGSIMSDDRYEPRNITLNSLGNYFKIRSAITGHGQEGEFIPRTHFLNINGGAKEFQWDVWKACSRNPIYPQGGTWVYDRAGWCPGAPTDLKEYDITSMVSAGQNVQFDYGVTTAAGDSRYIVNNQLVQYGAANFSLDAAIVEIKQPTERVEYSRINPICENPVVTIRNTGSTPLTSLEITFGIEGNTPQVFNWTGNLSFMNTIDVNLGNFNWTGTSNYFTVTIDKPNGGTDEYAKNNSLKTFFNYPAVMPDKIIIELRTNSRPEEDSYTLKDMYGNVLKIKDSLIANKIYKDTFNLTDGCYEFKLTDTGNDGLYWWASSQGTGYVRIRNGNTNAIIKTFEPDFGGETYLQFSYGIYTSVKEYIFTNTTNFKVYPNPSSGEIYVNIDFPERKNGTVEIYDINGKKIFNYQIKQQTAEGLNIDFSKLPKGMYIAILRAGNEINTQKFILE